MPVLLPYRFTLFSNLNACIISINKFYYLIDLHYSQTNDRSLTQAALFYYLIDLHYSQTTDPPYVLNTKFYYLIDLHYSQTSIWKFNPAQSFTTL